MSKLRVLNFQYNLSKTLKPLKRLSTKDRQVSDLIPKFQPNTMEMKKVFDKIDSNNDGKISEDDLRSLLEALDEKNVDSEVKSMMWAADSNMDGFIDFREFMEIHQKGISRSEVHSAFRMFDQDGDEKISAQDVMIMLRKLGESCSLEECQRMVRYVAKNGDRLVHMDDFMHMMTCTMKRA